MAQWIRKIDEMILADPILVGRSKELKRLQGFLESAEGGVGATVFVSGEAGSGKTRLANEFLDLVRNRGVTVLTGWCLSNAAVPYFPFIEAFDSYMSENEDQYRGVASQQFTSKSLLMRHNQAKGDQKSEVNNPQACRDQTFDSVTKELLNISNNKPLILFIDDVHWADSASLALLHYLSRAIRAERILILATFRSEEVSSPFEGHPNSLAETLRLMGREDLFTEIKLANLNESEVAEIAKSMLCGSLHPRLAEKLAKESQGNPLFVVESLRMLNEQNGLFQEENGQWSLDIDKFGVPTKVKDIIMRRLTTLNSDQRRVLDAASVVGEKFDPELLGAVLDQEGLRVLEELNTIAHSNSLICCEENVFRFDHAKSRDVLYEEIFPPLRRGYHSRIAQRIEANFESYLIPPLSDLAYHYDRAGDKKKSVRYALAAGQDALSRFSNAEAIKHFTYVLQTVSDAAEFDKERIVAFEGLGDAFFANGMFDDSLRIYLKIMNSETGVFYLRAFRKAISASFWLAKPVPIDFLGEVNKAKQYFAFDGLEAARVLMWKGKVSGWTGNPKAPIEELASSLKVFEKEYSLPDVASALFELSHMYALELQIENGLIAAQRSSALYEELGDIRGQMRASLWGAIVFGHDCGLVQEALDKYSVAIRIAEKIGDYITLAWVGLYQGALLESVGEFEAAVATSLRGLECAQKTNAVDMVRMNRANLTRQYAKLGDLANAQEYYEKLINDFPDNKIPGNPQAIAVATWSKAVFLAAKNRWKEANTCFETSLELLKLTLERVPLEAWTEADYASALEKQGPIAEANVHCEAARKLAVAYRELDKRLEHADIRAVIMGPKETKVGELFDMRIDLVNIGRNNAFLEEVSELIPGEFKECANPLNWKVNGKSLKKTQGTMLGAFQIETIKLRLQPTKPGVFRWNPQVTYADDTGANRTSKLEPFVITVQEAHLALEEENATVAMVPVRVTTEPEIPDSSIEHIKITSQINFEFGTETAKKIFNFLTRAFAEDYMKRRIALEKAGWRSLMEIVNDGKIPRYSVYGEGRGGKALTELEHRGLVEARVFPGERGRGGKIIRVRICYDKEPIKRQIDSQVMKMPEK